MDRKIAIERIKDRHTIIGYVENEWLRMALNEAMDALDKLQRIEEIYKEWDADKLERRTDFSYMCDIEGVFERGKDYEQ